MDTLIVLPEAPPSPAAADPVGTRGQLRNLGEQLRYTRRLLDESHATATAAMTDPDVAEAQRRAAINRFRALIWRVCREILPLVHRIPPEHRSHPVYRDVLRAYVDLRAVTQQGLDDHANWLLDLTAPRDTAGAPAPVR